MQVSKVEHNRCTLCVQLGFLVALCEFFFFFCVSRYWFGRSVSASGEIEKERTRHYCLSADKKSAKVYQKEWPRALSLLSHPVARQKVKRNWEKAAESSLRLSCTLKERKQPLFSATPNNIPPAHFNHARAFFQLHHFDQTLTAQLVWWVQSAKASITPYMTSIIKKK